MNKSSELITKRVSLQWIKADSGNTYLCPVKALEGLESPTEAQLKTFCVDESENPHND